VPKPLLLEVEYVNDVPERVLLLPLPDDEGYIEDDAELLTLPLLRVVGYTDDDPRPVTLLLGLDVGYTELEFAEGDPEVGFPLLYEARDELTGDNPAIPPSAEVDTGPIEDIDSVMVFP